MASISRREPVTDAWLKPNVSMRGAITVTSSTSDAAQAMETAAIAKPAHESYIRHVRSVLARGLL
jgi:hypothetical protein